MMRTSCGRIALVVTLGALVACSSQKGPEPEKDPSRLVASVDKVVVTTAATLPTDRKERFDKVDGTSRLTRAVESELRKGNRLDPQSGRVLEVEVIRYRVRSGATTFWFGMMAGVDMLDVKATVREGDKVVSEFATGAGSTGAFAGLNQESRFEKLATAVAERVVKGL
jgi:hypothetical protein